MANICIQHIHIAQHKPLLRLCSNPCPCKQHTHFTYINYRFRPELRSGLACGSCTNIGLTPAVATASERKPTPRIRMGSPCVARCYLHSPNIMGPTKTDFSAHPEHTEALAIIAYTIASCICMIHAYVFEHCTLARQQSNAHKFPARTPTRNDLHQFNEARRLRHSAWRVVSSLASSGLNI